MNGIGGALASHEPWELFRAAHEDDLEALCLYNLARARAAARAREAEVGPNDLE